MDARTCAHTTTIVFVISAGPGARRPRTCTVNRSHVQTDHPWLVGRVPQAVPRVRRSVGRSVRSRSRAGALDRQRRDDRWRRLMKRDGAMRDARGSVRRDIDRELVAPLVVMTMSWSTRHRDRRGPHAPLAMDARRRHASAYHRTRRGRSCRPSRACDPPRGSRRCRFGSTSTPSSQRTQAATAKVARRRCREARVILPLMDADTTTCVPSGSTGDVPGITARLAIVMPTPDADRQEPDRPRHDPADAERARSRGTGPTELPVTVRVERAAACRRAGGIADGETPAAPAGSVGDRSRGRAAARHRRTPGASRSRSARPRRGPRSSRRRPQRLRRLVLGAHARYGARARSRSRSRAARHRRTATVASRSRHRMMIASSSGGTRLAQQ